MTLSEFLLARIAEDEERAEFACEWYGGSDYESTTARVLAECEAKRRIVAHLTTIEGLVGPEPVAIHLRFALAALTLPYVDHPDYRPEWRP